MKIRPMGAQLYHTGDRQKGGRVDRQTDMTKIIVAFVNLRKRTPAAETKLNL